jgi:ribulose bisphosphate carboxylase small subunit
MDEFEKEDHLRSLEERIDKLKGRIDQEISATEFKLKGDLKEINESFSTLKDVIMRLHKEKEVTEKDRQFLMEKHKEFIRKIPVDKNKLQKEIEEKLVNPRGKTIRAISKKEENTEGVNLPEIPAAKERNPVKYETYKDDESGKTQIDELFEMVMEKGSVKIKEAAIKFKVHEAQIEEWAKILQEHGLIEIHYPVFGKPELKKVIR